MSDGMTKQWKDCKLDWPKWGRNFSSICTWTAGRNGIFCISSKKTWNKINFSLRTVSYKNGFCVILHSLWNFSAGDADPDFMEHTLLINALNRIFAGLITTHWSPPSAPWPENIFFLNCSRHWNLQNIWIRILQIFVLILFNDSVANNLRHIRKEY